MATKDPQSSSTRVITPDAIYPRAEFCRRAGMAEPAFRIAKERGLKVLKVGKRVWVRGSDFIEFASKQAGGRRA